jgi:hypothetical protein
MSHLNIVTSLENYDIKLFTQKVCFIPDFILTLDDVTKFNRVIRSPLGMDLEVLILFARLKNESSFCFLWEVSLFLYCCRQY